MKKLVLTALAMAVCAGAAEYQLHLDPETTQVNWTLGDVLHTVHGTFKLRRGGIVFDNESGKASGEVVVDAASGESGSSARDGRMHKNVLESAKYPDVSFTPDRLEGKVELSGVSNVKLHGTFRIHGGAHEITVPVKVTANGGSFDAEIKFEVPYVAWGMKDPSNLILRVSKSVEIEVRATGRLAQIAIGELGSPWQAKALPHVGHASACPGLQLEAQAQSDLSRKRDPDGGAGTEEIAQGAGRHAQLIETGDGLRLRTCRVQAKSSSVRQAVYGRG